MKKTQRCGELVWTWMSWRRQMMMKQSSSQTEGPLKKEKGWDVSNLAASLTVQIVSVVFTEASAASQLPSKGRTVAAGLEIEQLPDSLWRGCLLFYVVPTRFPCSLCLDIEIEIQEWGLLLLLLLFLIHQVKQTITASIKVCHILTTTFLKKITIFPLYCTGFCTPFLLSVSQQKKHRDLLESKLCQFQNQHASWETDFMNMKRTFKPTACHKIQWRGRDFDLKVQRPRGQHERCVLR